MLLLNIGGCTSRLIPLKEVKEFKHGATDEGGLYLSLDGVYSFLNQIHQTHTLHTRLYEIGKSSQLFRSISMIRIGYTKEEAESRFLIVAGTHGDEAASVAAVIYSIQQLLEQGNVQILEQRKIAVDFIPVHNPYGYIENQRENGNGIDLNRNFPFGNVASKMEPETKAVVNQINRTQYKASIFLHSGNEVEYENLVRVPVEFGKLGVKVIHSVNSKEILRLKDIIVTAGNQKENLVKWHSSSNMVNVPGLASDWCVSSFIKASNLPNAFKLCRNSHPSVTIELCYPKQPVNKERLNEEKQELFRIILKMINDF